MLSPDQRAAYAAAQQQLIKDILEHGHAVSGGWVGRQALLLNTIGAKTGEPRVSPLAYTRDGDNYIVTASKGGAPTHPAWYHNLLANPVASIDVEQRRIRVRASTAEGAERERLWQQHIAVHPGIGEYPSRTTRVIPVVVLEPLPSPEGAA
jgi:deazaflavin-dependent oxidoreductase (nitroreductase family)